MIVVIPPTPLTDGLGPTGAGPGGIGYSTPPPRTVFIVQDYEGGGDNYSIMGVFATRDAAATWLAAEIQSDRDDPDPDEDFEVEWDGDDVTVYEGPGTWYLKIAEHEVKELS